MLTNDVAMKAVLEAAKQMEKMISQPSATGEEPVRIALNTVEEAIQAFYSLRPRLDNGIASGSADEARELIAEVFSILAAMAAGAFLFLKFSPLTDEMAEDIEVEARTMIAPAGTLQ